MPAPSRPILCSRRWAIDLARARDSRAFPTGSIPATTSTRARSSRFSTAAPGTMSRWRRKFPRPAISSARGWGRRPLWSRAAATARSMSSRIAVPIVAQSFAGPIAAMPRNSSAPITNGPTISAENSLACRSAAGSRAKAACRIRFGSMSMACAALVVTTRRGVVFASFAAEMEPLEDYLGPEILADFDATFDGRPLENSGPLPQHGAGQLEDVSRKSEGPVPRDAASFLSRDLRPARRRQQIGDDLRRQGPSRHHGLRQARQDGRRCGDPARDARLPRWAVARGAAHARLCARVPLALVGDDADRSGPT